jgi:Bacterial regulatory proteins, luxR family
MTPSDEMFAEAANNWDLDRLYTALAEAKWRISPRSRKGLTEREKLYLRGLLCGNSPAEIARKLYQSSKGVEVYVSKTLYQYFKRVTDVPNGKMGNWRNIHGLLEEAGYKIKSSDESKPRNYLPLEPLVNIVNIGFEGNDQKTITIDINIRVALPPSVDDKETDDLSKTDRSSNNPPDRN